MTIIRDEKDKLFDFEDDDDEVLIPREFIDDEIIL